MITSLYRRLRQCNAAQRHRDSVSSSLARLRPLAGIADNYLSSFIIVSTSTAKLREANDIVELLLTFRAELQHAKAKVAKLYFPLRILP